jgi:hypothetical protein
MNNTETSCGCDGHLLQRRVFEEASCSELASMRRGPKSEWTSRLTVGLVIKAFLEFHGPLSHLQYQNGCDIRLEEQVRSSR